MTHRIRTRIWVAGAMLAMLAVAAACSSAPAAYKTSNAPPAGSAASGSAATTEQKAIGGAPADARGSAAQAPAPDGQAYSSTAGGAPGGTLPLPSQLDRQIILTATLEIATPDVSKRFQDVANIAAQEGGFVGSSSFGNDGDRQTASVTIRVPGDKYQDALSQLRKLGEVKGEKSDAADVTQDYTDLQSRLRNLKATELQYLAFLAKAENIGDVLQVQDRLNATRAEIEQVQGRIDLLAHQTDMVTVTVHLDPPIVAKSEPKHGGTGPLETARDSFRASIDVLVGIGTVALAVVAFSWWLLPLAGVGLYLGRRQLRAQRVAAPPASQPPAAQ
jgi:hypothetical protein